MTKLIRQGDARFHEKVTAISLATNTWGMAVTAVRDSDGNLKLISWRIYTLSDEGDEFPGGDYVTKKDVATGGPTSNKISISTWTEGTSLTAITAVRDASGKLELRSWQIGIASGLITALGHKTTDEEITEVAGTYLTRDIFVTAVCTESGPLKLITWDAGSLTRIGHETWDSFKEVTIIPTARMLAVPDSNYPYSLVTALTAHDGTLKVVTWRVKEDGSTITAKGENAAGHVGDVSVLDEVYEQLDPGDYSRWLVPTAVRSASGKLKIIPWRESTDGDQEIDRLTGDGIGHKLRKIATTKSAPESHTSEHWRLVVAGKNSDGKLALSLWRWSEPLTEFVDDDSTFAPAEAITAVALHRIWYNHVVTAVRTESGYLKVIAWKHKYA